MDSGASQPLPFRLRVPSLSCTVWEEREGALFYEGEAAEGDQHGDPQVCGQQASWAGRPIHKGDCGPPSCFLTKAPLSECATTPGL